MAVQIFKDGESIYVEPKALQRHLDCGWSADDPNAPVSTIEIAYPPELKGIENLPQDEQEKTMLEHMGITVTNPEPSIKKTKKKRRRNKKV